MSPACLLVIGFAAVPLLVTRGILLGARSSDAQASKTDALKESRESLERRLNVERKSDFDACSVSPNRYKQFIMNRAHVHVGRADTY